ncbi:MAG: phage portal protein [Pseudomonadota bacterium]
MRWPWQNANLKSSSALVALSRLPNARWGSGDTGSLFRDGFLGNPVVYRCVRMIAEAAGSIPLQSSGSDVAELLRDPAPEEAGRAFLERLYCDLMMTGNAFAEAVSLDGETAPRALFALPAGGVRPSKDVKGHIQGYTLRLKHGERQIRRASDGWMPVLHLKLYNPADPHIGVSPLMAARKALDLHNGAADWAKSLIDNAARPSGALIYGKDGSRLSDEQFDRLKSELAQDHMGALNAGRPLLLEGGLDWKPMSLSPADMDFLDTRNAAAREIALAFGVPPMLLGIPGDNTYATYKEANTAFWRLTVLPLVTRTADTLSVWLGERFNDAEVTPNIDQVPAFAADREAYWNQISAADFLTDTEKREYLGLRPLAGSPSLTAVTGGAT